MLKIPFDRFELFLDTVSISKLNVLITQHLDSQKENYEMIQNAVMFGYASAKKGKRISMYADDTTSNSQSKPTNKKPSNQEEIDKEVEALNELFS